MKRRKVLILLRHERKFVLRVADDDVQSLAGLEHLETAELVYHVGSLHSPGPGTTHFLTGRLIWSPHTRTSNCTFLYRWTVLVSTQLDFGLHIS